MFHACVRYSRLAVLAAVVITVAGQISEERALNTTGLWSKYNLIVKPTTANVPVGVTTVISTDQDARYKANPLKTKYNHKTDDAIVYLPNHNVNVDPESEELEQYSQEIIDDDADDDDDDEEDDEAEESPISEEQDEPQRSTTQRSQSIHQKAPIKVAVLDTSTSKSAERKQDKKKKKGHRPGASVTPTTVIHHHHHEDDDDLSLNISDDNGGHGHQKGHKHKGVKKYKIKGLKKLRKYMLPLLLAYKLKFFTLVPLLLGGLILIVASTGFAGFFFALFAVGVGLKKD